MKTLLILSSILFSSLVMARVEYFRGEAKNKKGEVVYTEQHTMTYEEEDLKVVETKYFKTSGEQFATLTSKFVASEVLPDSEFVDFRTNKKELSRVEGDQFVLTVVNEKGEEKSKKLKITNDMLCGQGYHNYLRKRLDRFELNKISEIKFVLPSKLDYFTFDLSMIAKSDSKTTFKLAITNFILKMFADAIEVDYDNQGNLLAYRGLSNIQNEKGDNMDVNITLTKVEKH